LVKGTITIIVWLHRHIFLTAVFAILILPIINHYLWPPIKGIMVLAELIAFTGWILYLLRPRGSHELSRLRHIGALKELTKGILSGLSIAGTLALLMPAASPFYNLNNLASNLFAAEPCTINNYRAKLTIDGTGHSLTATIDISRPPQHGEAYWIVSYSYTSTPQAYFAKKKLTQSETTPGHHDNITLTLQPDAGNDSSRTLWVACADRKASAELEKNYLDNENGPAKLPTDRRRALPSGVMKISNEADNRTQLPATISPVMPSPKTDIPPVQADPDACITGNEVNLEIAEKSVGLTIPFTAEVKCLAPASRAYTLIVELYFNDTSHYYPKFILTGNSRTYHDSININGSAPNSTRQIFVISIDNTQLPELHNARPDGELVNGLPNSHKLASKKFTHTRTN